MHLPNHRSHLTAAELKAGLSPDNAATLRMLGIAPDAFVKGAIKRLVDDPSTDPAVAQVVLAARLSGKDPESIVRLSLEGGRPHLSIAHLKAHEVATLLSAAAVTR